MTRANTRAQLLRLAALVSIIILILVVGLSLLGQWANIVGPNKALQSTTHDASAVAQVSPTEREAIKSKVTASPTSQASLAAIPTATPFPIPTVVPPDAENLPIYPNATDLNHDKINLTDWLSIQYKT